LVRMRIPIIPESEAMLFWAWLPMAEEDSLVVREGGMSLELRFDLDCLKGPLRPTRIWSSVPPGARRRCSSPTW